MAQMVTLAILGTPKVTFSASQSWGFPVGSFVVSPVQSGTTVPSGTLSVITVEPSGLNQLDGVYYSSATVADIITAANA